MVSLLLDVNPNSAFTRDKSGKLPIHRAARNGCSPEAIMNLLRVNPESAKTRDLKGKLPLHHACTSATNRSSIESLGVLRCLLESYPEGANTRDFSGRFPLQEALILASYRDNIPYCLDLIRLGADPELFERPGLNALTGIAFVRGGSISASQRRDRTLLLRAARKAFLIEKAKSHRWQRRMPFLSILAGCGYRPLLANRLALELDASMADEARSVPISTEEEKRAYRLGQVLSNEGLVRTIVSFL